ncbi:MAG: FAD-binding oxidoreductase [Sphingobium sp.]|nr:FAD-binding oxidoreductase [Sphingobium sp.]
MAQQEVDAGAAAKALKAFAAIVGAGNVFSSEEDKVAYSDHFAPDDMEEQHQPSGAVAPSTVEEIQAIVKIANEYKVPLWPISRGKNFGYGGAAPVLKGSIILDLSRMKKIEVDAASGTVLVEPGVSFFDLYDYLQQQNIPLWISVPGNSWGSVAGNALDRGVGYTPYGDHASRICGLEVVLPDGDLVRTGMGATAKGTTWQLYKPGFGPSWDTMFCQSNFGIVTKLGLWLMPEPESVLGFDIDVDKPEDLGWLIDTLGQLRREGILQQSPSIGNWLRAAATMTTREEWAKPGEVLDEKVIAAIRKKFNIGWWAVALRVYGPVEITEATLKVLERSFNGKPVLKMSPTRWVKGGAPEGSPATGVPVTYPLANANWFGGRGGHLGFSPVLPVSGDLALKYFRRNYDLHNEYGFDYHPSFAIQDRSMNNINQLLFDQDNPEMVAKLDTLFRTMVKEAAADGFAEYRTHIGYMDVVADTFDFNNHALGRLNRRVKDALDPNGILAPGKSGIWPSPKKGGAA